MQITENDCLLEGAKPDGTNRCWNAYEEKETLNYSLVIQGDVFLQKLKAMWYMILHVMQSEGVKVPVLTGISCGVFAGRNKEKAASFVAKALVDVLNAQEWRFDRVFLCQPAFYPDGKEIYRVFNDAFGELNTAFPVICTATHGAMALADFLTRRHKIKVGLLNPSDVHAVRQGFIGMYFDGGHIAMEEMMALQTTLVLAHRDINKALYTDESRRIAICLPTDLGDTGIHRCSRSPDAGPRAASQRSQNQRTEREHGTKARGTKNINTRGPLGGNGLNLPGVIPRVQVQIHAPCTCGVVHQEFCVLHHRMSCRGSTQRTYQYQIGPKQSFKQRIEEHVSVKQRPMRLSFFLWYALLLRSALAKTKQ